MPTIDLTEEQVIALLSRYAPTWLAQMPGLTGDAELETVQRRVQGATRESVLAEQRAPTRVRASFTWPRSTRILGFGLRRKWTQLALRLPLRWSALRDHRAARRCALLPLHPLPAQERDGSIGQHQDRA